MIEFIGWIGALMFALCALPQAVKSFKEGHSRGLSDLFLWVWLIGELCTIFYVIKSTNDIILLTNYFLNLGTLLIIMKFKYLERKSDE